MPQLYLTDRQLAERYGVSRATIWRWVNEGYLPPSIRLGMGTTRWPLAAIEERDAQAIQAAAPTESRAAKATRARVVRPAVRTRIEPRNNLQQHQLTAPTSTPVVRPAVRNRRGK